MNIYQITEVLDHEEQLDMSHAMCIQRKILRQMSPLDLADKRFFKLYRMPKELFLQVFEEVKDLLPMGVRSTRLDPMFRFAVAMSFYATGSYQTNVCQDQLSQNAAGMCIDEITVALARRLPKKWIRFPKTAAARAEIKSQFKRKYGVPGVIGCIDCTHVSIIAPAEAEHIYVDRNQKHSMNVQIICDSNLRILSVDATHPGSVHDASIWRTSADRNFMKRLHENNPSEKSWLFGDNGYPLEPWLITQYSRPAENSPEDEFNELHRDVRNCIERVNGILKMRWRCIMSERVLRYEPKKVVKFINVCCALHNICLSRGRAYNATQNGTNIVEAEFDDGFNDVELPVINSRNPLFAVGARARHRIANAARNAVP